jgi:hypothetical protein
VVPFSSDARNLAVVARLALAFRQPASGQPASRFVDELIAAASAQPDNPVVLANLGTVYDLVLAPKAGSPLLSATGKEREDYQRQRDALRRVLPPAAPAR